MSVISSAMRLLDEVGLIQADLDKAVGESAETKGAGRDKAIEVKNYWPSIAPVNNEPHRLTETCRPSLGSSRRR
jgi:hypothetical protein